jgi:amidase
MPTGTAVRDAIHRLSDRIARTGAKVAHSAASLPDLADSVRLYMRLLTSAKSVGMPRDRYQEAKVAAASLDPADTSLQAERTRGTVMTHRDWLETDRARLRIEQRWSEFFRDWDVVVYPTASVPAFPHDHSVPIEARHLEIDGDQYPYYDACFV